MRLKTVTGGRFRYYIHLQSQGNQPASISTLHKFSQKTKIYSAQHSGLLLPLQVLTVNGAVVLQRDLSEGAGLVHVVDRSLVITTLLHYE